MSSSNKYSPEVRERAVRMVFEHQSSHDSQWVAIGPVEEKIGCTSETLRKWVRQGERDQGQRVGLTSLEREQLKPAVLCIRIRNDGTAAGGRHKLVGIVHGATKNVYWVDGLDADDFEDISWSPTLRVFAAATHSLGLTRLNISG